MRKIGFGGGCHWCTEAVFQSLKGVIRVEQGFIASVGANATFSEAVLVHYDSDTITLSDLIAIHLHTHKSTVMHSMRSKYRSAVYTFDATQHHLAEDAVGQLRADFDGKLITQVLPFQTFKPSDTRFHNYYFSDSQKPFCSAYIAPKLKQLLEKYPEQVNREKQL